MKWTGKKTQNPLVMTVSAIRPDFIRLQATIHALDADPEVDHVLCHSGQHYQKELFQVFLDDLQIRQPDYNLGIGAPGKEHFEQVADLSIKIVKLAREIKPDLIIFLGDSNSVLTSIPLHKEGFKIAHIEAGMRSFDDRMFEETNRKACDHVSDLLFVYHENYKQHLLSENVSANKIFVVGNTIVEPVRKMKEKLRFSRTRCPGDGFHIVLDIHRPENFLHRDRLEKILDFSVALGERYSLPVKMLGFGRTLKQAKDLGLDLRGLEVVGLMGYKEFLQFQLDSRCIISDSGSACEEAPLLGVPCLVPREFTERPETYSSWCSARVCHNTSDTEGSLGVATDFISWYETTAGTGQRGPDLTWLGKGETSSLIIREIKHFLREKK